MSIARLPDWQSRLTSYQAQVTRYDFSYGRHDCALFVAGCVEAMTGHDFAAGYRGRYKSLRGGLKLLANDGFDNHLAVVRRHFAEVPQAFAQVGDIMVIEQSDGIAALGINLGERIAVLRQGELGLALRADASVAYRVP